MSVDLYRVLSVHPTAGPEEIRRAYLALARAHHPDVNRSPDANERFKAINAAYEVLGDPIKRAQYDAARSAEAAARQTQYQSPRSDPFRPPRPDYYPSPDPPEPSSRWLSFRRLWLGVWIILGIVRLAGFLTSDADPTPVQFRTPTSWVRAPPSATAPPRTHVTLDDLVLFGTVVSVGSD